MTRTKKAARRRGRGRVTSATPRSAGQSSPAAPVGAGLGQVPNTADKPVVHPAKSYDTAIAEAKNSKADHELEKTALTPGLRISDDLLFTTSADPDADAAGTFGPEALDEDGLEPLDTLEDADPCLPDNENVDFKDATDKVLSSSAPPGATISDENPMDEEGMHETASQPPGPARTSGVKRPRGEDALTDMKHESSAEPMAGTESTACPGSLTAGEPMKVEDVAVEGPVAVAGDEDAPDAEGSGDWDGPLISISKLMSQNASSRPAAATDCSDFDTADFAIDPAQAKRDRKIECEERRKEKWRRARVRRRTRESAFEYWDWERFDEDKIWAARKSMADVVMANRKLVWKCEVCNEEMKGGLAIDQHLQKTTHDRAEALHLGSLTLAPRRACIAMRRQKAVEKMQRSLARQAVNGVCVGKVFSTLKKTSYYYCDFCSREFQFLDGYNGHVRGKKHKKNAARVAAVAKLPTSSVAVPAPTATVPAPTATVPAPTATVTLPPATVTIPLFTAAATTVPEPPAKVPEPTATDTVPPATVTIPLFTAAVPPTTVPEPPCKVSALSATVPTPPATVPVPSATVPVSPSA